MTTTATIIAALAQLDPANPNHWTDDGLPRMDTVKFLAKDSSLTRDAVTAAAPGFTQANPGLPAATPAEPPAQAEPAVASTQGTTAPPIVAPAAPQAPQQPETGGANGTQQADDAGAAEPSAPEPTGLQAKYEAAKERLGRLAALAAEIEAERLAQSAEVDRLAEALEGEHAANPGNPVMDYLQHREREYNARAQRMLEAQAKQGGSRIGPAQIDVAMAYRRSRGTARPKVAPLE